MGQKVHPIGIRLGFIKKWNSVWYSNSASYSITLQSDIRIRKLIENSVFAVFIGYIKINRASRKISITIGTSRSNLFLSSKNEELENLKQKLNKLVTPLSIIFNIDEIKIPEINARLISFFIKQQVEKRIVFRRIIKRTITSAMKHGVKGIKVSLSGRLGGIEIARTEWSMEGRVPLHTFRADIDYFFTTALTTYGIIGIKVWIFNGEIFLNKNNHTFNSAIC